MARTKRILFLAGSDLGQANIFLAVSHALMQTTADVQIHLASYPALEKAVASTSALAQQQNPEARPIIFHPVNAISSADAMSANSHANVVKLIYASPSVWNMPSNLKVISRVSMPYTGPQMVDNYRAITKIVTDVDPDLCAVDMLYTVGSTVLHSLGVKFIVLSPNTLKDNLFMRQPRGLMFWKFPWFVPLISCTSHAWRAQ